MADEEKKDKDKYKSKATNTLMDEFKKIDVAKKAIQDMAFKNMDVKNIRKPGPNNTYGKRIRGLAQLGGLQGISGLSRDRRNRTA